MSPRAQWGAAALEESHVIEPERGLVGRDEVPLGTALSLPPGVIGIDAGMTLTKIARGTVEGILVVSHEAGTGPGRGDDYAHVAGAERIGVTGARVGDLAGLRPVQVQEIDAAARGVVALLDAEDRLGAGEFVMVLLGTGTAFAAVRGETVSHLGGTPLGGGSFAGIARRIDATLSYTAMIASAGRGDRRRVDAMISDVYPEGIGRVAPDLTAAHLAKTGGAIDDVLAGLLNLHGENIAQIGASRAIIANMRRIVVAGGFAHGNPSLVASMTSMAGLFGVSVEVTTAPGFAGAIGAALAAAVPP